MLAFIEVYAEPKDLSVAPSAALDHEILHAVILTHHRLSAKPELRFSLILVLYFGGGRAEAGRLPNVEPGVFFPPPGLCRVSDRRA